MGHNLFVHSWIPTKSIGLFVKNKPKHCWGNWVRNLVGRESSQMMGWWVPLVQNLGRAFLAALLISYRVLHNLYYFCETKLLSRSKIIYGTIDLVWMTTSVFQSWVNEEIVVNTKSNPSVCLPLTMRKNNLRLLNVQLTTKTFVLQIHKGFFPAYRYYTCNNIVHSTSGNMHA